ncbi:G1/S-specific cyclin-E protein [Wolffia australiana]
MNPSAVIRGDPLMETAEKRFFFPLTSLQIGDMQSYLSLLTIFLPPISKKFLIFVDCRPWLTDKGMRPEHFWQLMVTKSRLSPFANRRVQRKKKVFLKKADSRNGIKSNLDNRNLPRGLFSLVGTAVKQQRAFPPFKKLKDIFMRSSDLHDTFYGFIIFEVSWADVRGINYLNELLTDTSMAVEAKIMKRWEFDSVHKASSSLSSWFNGTNYEKSLLRNFLNDGSKTGDLFFDSNEPTCSVRDDDLGENKSLHEGVCKRRKITKSNSCKSDGEESVMSPVYSRNSSSDFSNDGESTLTTPEESLYKDVLILFRFNDHELPFTLQEIIMLDRRLLTLLEYGLPSWVIFLQSYPVCCNIYRPWMCPLARLLYIAVSVATVLIGFYDLYKNVPVLKATASRLCGPLFNWIENWEMISRIKCLGTMIFLHNFEITVEWFLVASRATKSLISVVTAPLWGPMIGLVEFLEPWRVLCFDLAGYLGSVTWDAFGSTCSIVMSSVNLLLRPFWLILSLSWSLATSVIYPIIWVLWEALILPARLIFGCMNILLALCYSIWGTLGAILSVVSPLFQIVPRSPVSSVRDFEVPLWRSLCLKVFHALKGILYGLIAFFATCNRHRLSISSRFQEIVRGRSSCCRKLSGSVRVPKSPDTNSVMVSQRGKAQRRRRAAKNKKVAVEE